MWLFWINLHPNVVTPISCLICSSHPIQPPTPLKCSQNETLGWKQPYICWKRSERVRAIAACQTRQQSKCKREARGWEWERREGRMNCLAGTHSCISNTLGSINSAAHHHYECYIQWKLQKGVWERQRRRWIMEEDIFVHENLNVTLPFPSITTM